MHIWRLIAYLQSIDRSSDISWAAEMDPMAAGVGFLHFAIGKTFHLQGAPLEQMTNIWIKKKPCLQGIPCKAPRWEIFCNLQFVVRVFLPSRVGLPFSCFHPASPASEARLEIIFSCFLTSEGSAQTKKLRKKVCRDFFAMKNRLILKDRMWMFWPGHLRLVASKDGLQ